MYIHNWYYLYRADGTKLRKTYNSTGPRGGTKTTNIIDYLDGFQYSNSTVTQCIWCRTDFAYEEQAFRRPINPGGNTPVYTLDFVNTAEGVYSFTENRYIYQYVDHLGNVRLNYAKDTQGNLEITNTNNYYAFGMNHIGGIKSMLGGYKNYKYNGKELQETGMYDYGARFYMSDIGRWGVVDPLAETSRRWSPYTYAYNNPIRFVDPDGMQNEDKIKIFNDGKIERTKDNNNYDTVTNENESKFIRIARTNITEKNPTGDSQIGEAITTNVETPGHDGISGGTQFTYMQIQDYDVATQVFEFAADNTKVEFGQDTLNFTDGYSTNIVSTNHSENESSSAVNAIGYIDVSQPGSVSRHFINKATREERVHSHPGGPELEVGPSGFDAYRSLKTGEVTVTPSTNRGDRASYDSSIKNVYQYTPGYGYFKYNNNSAIYNGSKKSKKYILLVCVLIILNGCQNNISGQRKNNLYQNIVKAFIENKNSKIKIDPQTNILLIGANTSENIKDAYWLDMSFVNPKLLHNFKYTKVYEIEGYRLIIDELLNKSSELKSSFKETKYENLNLATEIIDYDSKHWLITFNSKNEIIRISPQQKSKEIKEILLKKGVKFSKDFEE